MKGEQSKGTSGSGEKLGIKKLMREGTRNDV